MFRTLVVDDEPQVRDLTNRALTQCDIPCDTAHDGEEAMALCENGDYDLVVTDLRMPKRHGHSLAVELLSRPNPPHVMVVTGLAEPRLVRDLMSRGVEDVLYKPVDFNVLAMKVLALSEKSSRSQDASRSAQPMPNVTAPPTEYQKLNLVEKSLSELTEIFEESLTGLFDFEEELNELPKSIDEFITRFAQQEGGDSDGESSKSASSARAQERLRTEAVAVAVPVTRRFSPTGDPFRVAIRDVSEGGIRLLHTRATNAKYLALSWNADTLPSMQIQVVAKVMRCRPLSPFYDIGGQFVMSD